MKKHDEIALANAVLNGEIARDAGERLGMAPGRVEYLCEKWAIEGWYAYGVTCDLGWAERVPVWLNSAPVTLP